MTEPPTFQGLSPAELELRIDDTKRLILVGDSPMKHADFPIARRIYPNAEIMTVNNAARMGITPNYVATLHGGKKDFIGTSRMPLRLIPDDCILICQNMSGWEHERTDLIFSGNRINGTSALFAMLSAVYLGFGRILMVGCDMQTDLYGNGTTFGSWGLWAEMLCKYVVPIRGKLLPIFDEARDAALQPTES